MKTSTDFLMDLKKQVHYYTLTEIQYRYHIDPDAIWEIRKTAAFFQLYGIIIGAALVGLAWWVTG